MMALEIITDDDDETYTVPDISREHIALSPGTSTTLQYDAIALPGCPHCRLSEIFAHREQQRLDGLHCLWCRTGVLNNIFGLPTLDSHATQLVW